MLRRPFQFASILAGFLLAGFRPAIAAPATAPARGVLEFHVVATPDDLPASGWQSAVDRLRKVGAGYRTGDPMGWLPIRKAATGQTRWTEQYMGASYMLLWMTADKSLDHRGRQTDWSITHARRGDGADGKPVVELEFDTAGAAAFRRLTENNIGKPLAIVLDGRIVTAPLVRTVITKRAVVDGGADGFTPTEVRLLVDALNRGASHKPGPMDLDAESLAAVTVVIAVGTALLCL